MQSLYSLPPNSLPTLSLSHPLHKPSLSYSLSFLYKSTSVFSLSSHRTHLRAIPDPWALLADALPPEDYGGPVELSPDMPSIFATNDDPTPLQVATSVLLTGAITVFLFRSVRRRAKRAKELRMRSSGAKKTLKEEALDSLKAVGSLSVERKGPPSAVQTLLGGITAGVIALILYKFTTTIEAALNRQTVSDNFSVRQITITVRTIINGLCYLATFVFGINSLGLFLYSGQLALNSLSEGSTNTDAKLNDEKDPSAPNFSSENPDNRETSDADQNS